MAVALLGGNISTAAAALDYSYQCVHQWPEFLTGQMENAVVFAVAWRDPICRARLKQLGLAPPIPPAPKAPKPVKVRIPPQLRDI